MKRTTAVRISQIRHEKAVKYKDRSAFARKTIQEQGKYGT